MYLGHIGATVRSPWTGFTRLIERRASTNGQIGQKSTRRNRAESPFTSHSPLSVSGQLRPRRDFRDYLFAAGARTHAAHHTRPTRGVRNPTGKASNRPRSPADDARTDNLCGEFRPRTAAQRCPTLADVYPDSSRRKYGREYECLPRHGFFRFDACRPRAEPADSNNCLRHLSFDNERKKNSKRKYFYFVRLKIFQFVSVLM